MRQVVSSWDFAEDWPDANPRRSGHLGRKTAMGYRIGRLWTFLKKNEVRLNCVRTYLDFNATAPIRDEARLAVIEALDSIGNPSSVHGEGRAAQGLIEAARAKVAAYLGVNTREIVFTSGASESNNWVISSDWAGVVTTAVEHESVLAPASKVTCPCHTIAVDANGVLDLASLERVLGSMLERVEDAEALGNDLQVLVSVQAANGETGVVQPLGEVRQVLDRYHGVLLHVDGVQLRACHRGLLANARPDFVSLSAHKIGGPKGVGALFVRKGLSLEPMMFGGGQEVRRRPGTQNVPAIAGFGAAAEVAGSDLEVELSKTLRGLRDELERGVVSASPSSFVAGVDADRLCNTSYICVPGVRAETLVMALDLEGFAVSAGSACSSGKVTKSHVLQAMGFDDEISGSAVRVSLGWSSSREDIERFLSAWQVVTQRVFGIRSGSLKATQQVA